MTNRLPAIVIGGPPHAGKSVLFHSLTCALHEQGLRHHAIRACPDGEGNWSQESDQETVEGLRSSLKVWPDSFVQRICQDIEHRCLPFLVDMGGHPRPSQYGILRLCTHVILLLRADCPADTQRWQQLVEENGLTPLAQITSQLDGTSIITSRSPAIEGVITDLVRDNKAAARGPVFDALVERIATLFKSYSPQDLERVFFEQAPTELLDLFAIVPSDSRWTPEMLPEFLESLPENTALSVYGKAPNWVYAAVAAYTDPLPLYQFDPRLPFGWIQPFAVRFGTERDVDIVTNPRPFINEAITTLSIAIGPKHLDYFWPEPLSFPPIRAEHGLIIDGIIPFWLLTALVRLYKRAGVAWIAPYYPQLNGAVVAYSRVSTHRPGDLIALPTT